MEREGAGKDEMKMSLGRFIATRRKRMSLTQEELAAMLNVSNQQLQNGKRMEGFRIGIICIN